MTAAPYPVERTGEPMADRARPPRAMTAELGFLRATSDRSDPLDEAVLCVVEAAVRAMDAADRARTCAGSAEVHGQLREVLASARAAVTAATFAVTAAHDAAAEARTATEPPSGN